MTIFIASTSAYGFPTAPHRRHPVRIESICLRHQFKKLRGSNWFGTAMSAHQGPCEVQAALPNHRLRVFDLPRYREALHLALMIRAESNLCSQRQDERVDLVAES